MGAKASTVDELCRQIHHHPSLSSSNIRVGTGDGRTIVLEPVTGNKYTIRSDLLDDFTHSYDGHTIRLVIELFTDSRIEVVPVDTTAHSETVEEFLNEFNRSPQKTITSYDALSLSDVEALEEWGAVGRISELDPKHIHDAFYEYYQGDSSVQLVPDT
jgi:hypothetical protein